MTPSPHNPETLLSTLEPTELDEYLSMVSEGYELDPADREEHFAAVAELVGDMALFDALAEKANQDILAAEQVADGVRRTRGQTAAVEIADHGYAKIAPRFDLQVTDEKRTNTFEYVDSEDTKNPDPEDIKQMTEAEGLQQLYGFLADFYNDSRYARGVDKFTELSARSHSMLENLSFIGEKEFQEAAYGLAAYWKNYLDEDEKHQICVMAPVSHSARYADLRKSDEYFRDRILQTFTDEELEKYSGRIVGVPEDLTAEPEDTKVILLDDWAISGRELRTAFDEQHTQSDAFYAYAAGRTVEINLLIASEGRLDNGLKLNPTHDDPDLPSRLPVRSYYRSRYSPESQQEHKSHVSGTHSSVNYDFDKDINRGFPHAIDRFNRFNRLSRLKECASRIALANIIPRYRSSESEIEITADQLRRTTQEK